ncbi:D-aminoacyl-tRNA deacylase [Dasania sp. GY-MA-18]|uniref:D-aminoacyl-tRNA deacylase n=1 Tax=Dasania phycosphaerae TaxID=2950436 RepID=A0A9J6RNB7_9GAMM|nr:MULTISPECIES: D-aminoacyl-tRNA deacylase [Dasania]MCR8923069.1 D-aminoacyl-tRNA deacylase [Dasania sp. GY-MA-18]MCZ0865501.1 D-aminoacyl-tRNA deacylase [Dasania phycosphaerae]MCZ0869226.1 D-aminoacyl-tRNA deacylase [Dasania phycosphaerae]
MKALIQRVTQARVTVAGETVGEIQQGLLVLLGVERDDDTAKADKLAEKLIAYRVFADEAGKMNCSLNDINGGLLLVSQFTLAAETKKGLRPGFSTAAAPELAQDLYRYMIAALKAKAVAVQTGEFGADMQVSLTNDGPVTFLLEV